MECDKGYKKKAIDNAEKYLEILKDKFVKKELKESKRKRKKKGEEGRGRNAR